MEIEEKQDVEELEKSLELAQKFFEVHPPQLLGDHIGQQLVLKTLEIVRSRAADTSHYYFTSSEIHEWLSGEKNSEKARRRIGKNREYLAELFSQTSSLNEMIVKKKLTPLSIELIEHKGGKPNQWRIRTGKERVISNSKKEATVIRYVVTKLHDPMPWAKPLMHVILSPKLLLISGITFLALICAPIYTLLGIINWGSKPFATAVVVVGMFAALLFWRLYELLHKGVTSFPVFWSKKIGRNKLFLSESSGAADKPLGMKAVTIEAKCSICGEDILIEKSREFHGRYVGKCRVAPSEHVFSFDHVTKRGKHLR